MVGLGAAARPLGIWTLGFEICLGFGFWDLDFSP
jgi:hypothetical protein